jgi:predicted nucleic acid-binding protein
MTSLFIDTGAWYALFNQRDMHHQRARAFFEGLKNQRIRLFTSDYIFDETLTLLRYHAGYQMARQFGEHFRRSKVICEGVTPEVRESAWQIFCDYEDQAFSFTDCTSFALMRMKNIQDVFAFDAHFQICGFTVHPF